MLSFCIYALILHTLYNFLLYISTTHTYIHIHIHDMSVLMTFCIKYIEMFNYY